MCTISKKCSIYRSVFGCREGRGNAHLKGDYQKIGDVMLRNMTILEVTYTPLFEFEI